MDGLAIRKNKGAIFKYIGKDLLEVGASVKNISHICGYKYVYLYKQDNYIATLDSPSYAIKKVQMGLNKIEINPKSELSSTSTGVFYGAKDDNVLTYYDFEEKN